MALALVSGLMSGGFVLVGAGLTHGAALRREKIVFRRESALGLAEMEHLIWGDDWIDLRAQLEHQTARLAVAGVPEDLGRALQEISTACWRDRQESIEHSAGTEPGISRALLDARDDVHRAIRAVLLREGSRETRRQLRSKATEAVDAAILDR